MSLATESEWGLELESGLELEWEWELELKGQQSWGTAKRPARETPAPGKPPGGMLKPRQTRLESQVAEASQCAWSVAIWYARRSRSIRYRFRSGRSSGLPASVSSSPRTIG
jgi:hypothetical protein